MDYSSEFFVAGGKRYTKDEFIQRINDFYELLLASKERIFAFEVTDEMRQIAECFMYKLMNGEIRMVEPCGTDSWGNNVWVYKGILLARKVQEYHIQAKDREDGAYLAQTVKNEDGYFHTACHIGAQAVIGRNSIIGVGAQIGEKTIVSPNCVIDSVPLELTILIGVISPAIVEEGCYLGPGCMLSADVRIGEYSYLYPGTVITSSTWVIDYNGEKCARGETPPYSVLRNSMYEGAFERDRYAQPAVRVVRRLDRNDVARLNRHQIMYEGML